MCLLFIQTFFSLKLAVLKDCVLVDHDNLQHLGSLQLFSASVRKGPPLSLIYL